MQRTHLSTFGTSGTFGSVGVSRREFVGLVGALGLGAGLALIEPARQARADGAREVKIHVSNNAKPFCYLDADGTTITGYDVESLKLCEQKLSGKYAFSFDAMDFNTMISSLQTGSCDMVSCCLVPNDDRRSKFLFSTEPYVLAPMCLLTRKDSDIKTLEDMAGKTIAQNPVNYEYGMLMAYNQQHPDVAMKILEVNSSTQADTARLIVNGQADASLIYVTMFDTYQQAAGVELGHTDVVLTESCYYMLAKGEQELADDLDKALKEAKSDGSLAEVSKKWTGHDSFGEYGGVLSDNMLLADGETRGGSASSGADVAASSRD